MDEKQRDQWNKGDLISEINASTRRKALLIGINYVDSPDNLLDGCVKDAEKVMNHLVKYWKFQNNVNSLRFLSDEQIDPRVKPTRANIIDSLEWLVKDAEPGDSLFLHFSGHGGVVPDEDGDEEFGYDQAILTSDLYSITDDEMNKILVQPLPLGVRLTCIFDCCYSGSILDLPYTYNNNGECKELQNIQLAKMKSSRNFMGLRRTPSKKDDPEAKLSKKIGARGSLADIICFSSCKDYQEASDNDHALDGPQGALTGAVLPILEQKGKQLTYGQLILALAGNLKNLGFFQIPQLTTSRYLNVNRGKFEL